MGTLPPPVVQAVVTVLTGGGVFSLVVAVMGRRFQAEKQKLEERIQTEKERMQLSEQADGLRREMRLGDREETKALLENLSARLKAAEEKGDRRDAKIDELQRQIDELRSEKFRLEGQLHALELLKATETQRANMAEEQMVILRERICLLEEQLRLANLELTERQARRRDPRP